MNKFQKILNIILGNEPEKKEVTGNIIPFRPTGSFGLGEPAPMDSRAQMEAYRSWVYSAANKISSNLAWILSDNTRLFRRKGPKDMKEVETHDILNLLDRVNDNMTRYDLFELLGLHLELVGEAFWWKIKNKAGKPVEIWPWINPSYMNVVPGKDEFIKGYIYIDPGTGQSIPFSPDEIVHFKYTNPSNPYRGISPVKAAEISIASDRQANKWNWTFFKNGGRPLLVLSVPGTLTQEQYNRVVTQWENRHQGTDNAHKLAVIESGNGSEKTEVKEIGIRQKDMDFIEQRKMNKEEIYEIFGIPKGMMSGDVNRSTSQEHQAFFMENTIIPKVRKILSVMNEFLVRDFGNDGMFFDFDDPSPKNVERDIKYYESGIQNGWLTPNEVRKLENLETVKDKGADDLYIPNNLTPIATSKGTSKGRDFHLKKMGQSESEIVYNITKNEVEKSKKNIEKKSKMFKGMDEQQKENIWREKILRTNEDEEGMTKMLIKEFKRQEQSVLESVSTKSYKQISFNFDIKKESDRLKGMFEPFVRIIINKYGEQALTSLLPDVQFSDGTERVKRYLNQEGLKFAKAVNKTTKEAIKDELRKGVEAGEGITKLKNRIKLVFKQATSIRAERIARTEVSRASNMATEEGWIQSGVVSKKEWLTALDERVCPYCAPMHGKIIKLGRDFFKKGSSFKGDAQKPLNFGYSDVTAPPLHVSCRCTLIPVIE